MHMRLQLKGVAVRAGGRDLFAGVDLRLEAGERVALWGESGIGKTSLLRVIAQLDDARAGELRLDGETPEEVGIPAYRRRVLYVPQRPALFAATVRENLERPFRYASATGAFDVERAAFLLERVGFPAARLDEQARTLSVGEQQRVCLVRALSLSPDVLLLDEPTSAVDAPRRLEVEALVAEAAEQGLAALVVTHDAAQVTRFCSARVDLAEYAPRG